MITNIIRSVKEEITRRTLLKYTQNKPVTLKEKINVFKEYYNLPANLQITTLEDVLTVVLDDITGMDRLGELKNAG